MDLVKVEVLFDRETLKQKVAEMGKQISRDYKGRDLLVVGILKGAFVFMADLIREMEVPVELDFMDVSSYGISTSSSGEVRIVKDLEYSIKDRDVLIVEDIVDTGLTLKYICEILRNRNPRSLKIACLLDKPSRRKTDIHPDYVGYTIPDKFVVGYGLDYAEQYRHYPAVCVLKPAVYEN
ncbi:MAG: hypoxanthine phosphoribosyltransferase [Syntrophomonas sp.]|uniref:Hypoxanthine phosphoribosyltransferase n=1 Tax=Syntrophomonas wolfei TaxID=863 RepID=A0A354YXJ8_9FIRM|nr:MULTISPECIES: hypoxanthine phosphoribosyltransferase [Syntrophomonas]MDD2511464.1 hypoxanthine phosphoribosyltransferase [Syntrophomonas sp.]MDD3880187.1 hypoxanthine phosphoribosyltransferase [Syntrophomonas sp.]MDD4626929.1 hypoxanthine phosphoribosyltransferase [Syntrophomonas sp.]HBK53436.1 hypoxanthine phosphoribosyltransferase [Syntrophomonas wolfei]